MNIIKHMFNKLYGHKLLVGVLITIIISLVSGLVYARLSRTNPVWEKQSSKSPSKSPQATVTPANGNLGVSLFGQDTNEDQVVGSLNSMRNDSAKEVGKILSKLPIYIENFKTSENVVTTINIYLTRMDNPSFIRVEVYGINYNYTATNNDNPNFVAFKDSFVKAKEEIRKAGANPDKLIYIFYTRENIHLIAESWARNLGLISY